MFGIGREEVAVLVLRDADEIGRAVQRALVTAGEEERPGLERAAAIVAEAAGRPDAELRTSWVRNVLREAEVDPASDHIGAVATLRQAVPGLSLLAANELAKEAAAWV